jgi:hypothetical protein
MLTKSEITKAVEAIRSLSDVIERLEKATWPESQSDVLRKLDNERRASDAYDPAKRALGILDDAERRIERLEAQRDLDAQHERRKTAPRETSQ